MPTHTSRGARMLGEKDGIPTPSEEANALRQTIQEIEEWWRSDRWSTIRRPYSAADVASLRQSPIGNGRPSMENFRWVVIYAVPSTSKGGGLYNNMARVWEHYEYELASLLSDSLLLLLLSYLVDL